MVFDSDSDVFAVIGGFVFHCFIDTALGEKDFKSGCAGAEASDEENDCREGSEKGRVEVNQQAEANKHKAGNEYAGGDFAGGLRDHICIKLKRHFCTSQKN